LGIEFSHFCLPVFLFSCFKVLQMNRLCPAILIGMLILLAGCGGSSETVLPTTELTEEQKAAVKAEDTAIDDEESGKSR
jgi:hypothetical protein